MMNHVMPLSPNEGRFENLGFQGPVLNCYNQKGKQTWLAQSVASLNQQLQHCSNSYSLLNI
jgi:hypothetical protein